MMKKVSLKSGILVAILFLAIGFAAITTTLVITGVINIVPDNDDFETKVIFASAKVDEESEKQGATAVISEDGKSIIFTTQTLKDIDDETVLTYTIKNNSEIDAVVKNLSCTSKDNRYDDYLTVTASNSLATITATTPLEAGTTSASDTLKVKLKRSFAGTEDGKESSKIEFECTIPVSAAKSD